MTLRKRTLTIIGIVFVSLTAILYLTAQNIFLDSFVKLEEYDTRRNVERTLSALSGELSFMDAMAQDWAVWDDTYAFIEDANQEYVSTNLVDDTFTHLKLNLIMYINSAGSTVFAKAFDLQIEQEVPIPQSLQQHLAPGAVLLTQTDAESGTEGLILLSEGLMLVAARSILTSEGEGPSRGTLIMGRYLDSGEVQLLAEKVHLPLAVYQLTDSQMPLDFGEARLSLSAESPIFVKPIDEESVGGYTLLQDIYGEPALLLRIAQPRDIYQQGKASIAYLILAITGVGLVFGAATILLLEKGVLSRLFRLSKSVSSIGKSGDLSARVSMSGSDELTGLADTINGMLSSLQQSEEALKSSRDYVEKLADAIPDIVLSVKHPGRIIEWVNDSIRGIGYEPEECIGRTTEFLYRDRDEFLAFEKDAKEAVAQGKDLIVSEYQLRKRNGEIFPVEMNVTLFIEKGRLAHALGVFRDVTERKKMEEALRSSRDYIQSLVDSVQDIIVSVKLPERVIEWTNVSVRSMGYEPQECIGRTTEFLYKDRDEFLAIGKEMEEAVALGKTTMSSERLFRRKNGEVFPVEIRDTLLKEEGKITHAISISRDISVRKKMEQELIAKSRELEAASRAKSDFLSHMSHELRTLLNAVIGFSELMLDGIPGEINEEQRGCLN
ncbi:MAG: PAS domain S-box protein, partial [Chloroflexi bacterium]|nr:PAS domain S-box protein [Chloroflexota bacterium]